MNREKKLLKNTFILALGNFLPQLTALITLPIYTGMLTTTEYGRYDLINVLVYILTVLVTVQIHQAVFRFLIDKRGTKEESIYVSNAVLFEIIPSIMVSIIFGIMYHGLPVSTRILLGLYLFFNIQYTVSGQIARGLGNNRIYAIASIVNSVLNMILVVILVSGFQLGFNGLFLSLNCAYLAGTLIQVIACDIHKKFKFRLRSKKVIKKLLNYSWPMVPNTLSIWIVNSSNKLIISFFLGVEMNGIFAVAQKIPNIFNLANSTFNMAWQESASIAVSEKDSNQYYSNVFNTMFNFLTGCILLLISATPILFTLLIRGPYEEAYLQMPLLYIGVFFSSISSFFGSIYIAKRRTAAVGVSSAIGAIINIVINISLIRYIGLYAASFSVIISYFVLVVYRIIDIERKGLAKIQYKFKKIIICLILIIISSYFCYQRMFITDVINLVIGIIGFIILNKSFIKVVLKYFLISLKKR